MLSEAMPVRSWQLPWVFAVSVDASSWVASLSQLVREARARRVSLSAHVGTTTDTTAVAVFREDGAAMLGGLIALTGLALHQITGSAMPTQGEPGDPRRQRSVPFLAPGPPKRKIRWDDAPSRPTFHGRSRQTPRRRN